MNFLKKKITREIAVIAAMVLAFLSAYNAVDGLFNYMKYEDMKESSGYGYGVSDRYADTADLSGKLWLILHMYEANIDANGEIKGNEYFKSSLQSEMYNAGIVDRNGKLVAPESENYRYVMKSGGKTVAANGGETADVNSKYMYEMTLERDGENHSYNEYATSLIPGLSFTDCRGYTNTKGMYYYYSNGRGYAVYDYDTSGLKYYYDDLGARIYINRDGTVPIPQMYNDSDYPSFDADEPIDMQNTELKNSGIASVKIYPVQKLVDEYEEYLVESEKCEAEWFRKLMTSFAVLALSGMLGIYIIASGGYDEKTGKFVMRTRDTIYGELFLITGFVIPFMFVVMAPGFAYESVSSFDHYGMNNILVKSVASIGLTALFMVAVASVDTVVNRFKCRKVTDTFLVTGMIKKMWAKAKNVMGSVWMSRNEAFTIRFFIRVAEAVAAGIVAVAAALLTNIFLIIPVAAILILIFYIYESMKDLKELNDLSRQITGISSGDYTPKITSKTSVTYGMATRLNCISDGIQTAVEEQIRSERMKIELVTNVSHDLKTPLTSIISYVDLLSREELPPAAMDYVAVLEQKTDRLRTIVSDVFDLAKATSSTDVNIERLDAVILMNQVLADMSDKQERYGREIKTEIKADSAFIDAEGKKMYRVLQNILDNALKYSMNGTRVFAKLEKANGSVRITVKNTSSYEMNFSPEEITERFARGDKARTTEGSGLGLSIAKSFTEACGGRFDIKIDGDLFIAEVEFPEVQTEPEVSSEKIAVPQMV
ncbi:HAMP domain-containing sensor histidine kinase [Ruminococcus sp. HUN007]|uniref:sensor histidine kinase n=1 Tax=Ruminococcus sp. HUN007 TaxID=1514668 RepID=UPI0006795EED|nr:HAMP domain-containing sensor histidine kinase [Ruminococcus sp. HUN007]